MLGWLPGACSRQPGPRNRRLKERGQVSRSRSFRPGIGEIDEWWGQRASCAAAVAARSEGEYLRAAAKARSVNLWADLPWFHFNGPGGHLLACREAVGRCAPG